MSPLEPIQLMRLHLIRAVQANKNYSDPTRCLTKRGRPLTLTDLIIGMIRESIGVCN